jgi:Tol biopolymer transport system component
MMLLAAPCLLAGCCWFSDDPGRPGVGLYIAFDSYRLGTGGSRDVYLYDRWTHSLVDLPGLNTAAYEGRPSITRDGDQIFFTSDRTGSAGGFDLYEYSMERHNVGTRPGLNGSGREFDAQKAALAFRFWTVFASDEMWTWDICVYDDRTRSRVDLGALNTSVFDEEKPGISDDSKHIVFQANGRPGSSAGGVDVYLYDVDAMGLVNTPGLNSPADDRNPCISGDGRYIAFDSNRSAGGSNRALEASDVYVYDLAAMALVTPSPWNSAADDYWPHLNIDGSLMTFASDRPGGEGAADIYLYRFFGGFIDLPGLNSPQIDENGWLQ